GRARHDIYHLPSYVRFAAEHEGGHAAALYAESGGESLLAPVVLRPVPESLTTEAGQVDAVSPYGYSGPVTTAPSAAAVFSEMLLAARDAAARSGIVCGFFR